MRSHVLFQGGLGTQYILETIFEIMTLVQIELKIDGLFGIQFDLKKKSGKVLDPTRLFILLLFFQREPRRKMLAL